MNYKFIILLLFAFIVSCVQQNSKNDYNKTFDIYSNKGFTLIYNESLFKKKNIKKEDRQ